MCRVYVAIIYYICILNKLAKMNIKIDMFENLHDFSKNSIFNARRSIITNGHEDYFCALKFD